MPAHRPPAVRRPGRCRRASFRTTIARGPYDLRSRTCPCDFRLSLKRFSREHTSLEKRLALWAIISAALVATVTVYAHPRDRARALNPIPDEARKVLQRRRSKRVDLVEQFVVEHLAHLGHASFEKAEVQYHACRGIGRAAHRYLGTERVAMDLLARRAKRRSAQRMGGLEPERFRQFPHPENPDLPDTECLVGLQAEPPLRMAQTIVDRARGVFDHVRSVHRLQRETFEGEIDESFRGGIGLRINQLEFMALPDHEVGAGFRADADPVHALGRLDRTVGLDADFEAARMQRIDEGLVHLQQWFAAGQYHVMVGADAGPLRGDGIRKFAGRRIAAAQRAVGSDKIGVAKPARRRGAVLLAAAPEVAAGEPAKHRGPAGMGAFALQGQKDFLYGITHWACSAIAAPVYSRTRANATATLDERKSNRIPRFGGTGLAQLRRSRPAARPLSRQWTQRSPPLFKCGLVKAAARYEDGTWFFPCRSQGISSSAEWRRTACRSEWLDPATPQLAHK